MSNALSLATTRTAGAKQFAEIDFKFYQTLTPRSANVLYWDGSSYFTSLVSPVTSATYSVISTNRFLSASRMNTVFDPLNNVASARPTVGKSLDYVRITSTVINDGLKVTQNLDLSRASWAVLVCKSTAVSVAGKFNIRRAAGNEVTCAFTTSATANTPEVKIFDFKTSGAFGVTITGTPALNNYTDITQTEVTMNTANTLDVGMVYFVNDLNEVIGQVELVSHKCVDEATITPIIERVEAYCKQRLVDTSVSKQGLEFSLTTNSKDFQAMGLGLGSSLSQQKTAVIDTINSVNVGGKIITAGSISIPGGLALHSVEIDGRPYMAVDNSAVIPQNCYYYNSASSSSNLIFNTLENGKIPTVKIDNIMYLPGLTIGGMTDGVVGNLRIVRINTDGKRQMWTIPKCALNFENEATGDFDTYTFKYQAFSTPQDVVYQMSQEV